MKKNKMKGFTLVELLAVIVILAIILVIAVPKVMSIIEDAKMGTLESTAKMIASGAEKAKVQNTVLGNTKEITCDSVAKINKGDYTSCSITFEDNTAKVTIEGSGKFDGLWVCGGTKTNATAMNKECPKTLVAHIQELLDNEETLNNGLQNPKVTYEGKEYDTGIRYVGTTDEVKNKVYYNCEDVDSNGVSYGANNYDYESFCEVWRIIGVFDTKSSTSGTAEKRVKLINTASTFKVSWDSSTEDINNGCGVNQWGASTYSDGSDYEGADLMRLLNEYYIGANGATCTYCNGDGQGTCEQTCTVESLKNANMKVLTDNAKNMIENAVWDTYAVSSYIAQDAYLHEKGISEQYIGKRCSSSGSEYDSCNDSVERTTNWTGLVGLMSVSDINYAKGWLDCSWGSFTITPALAQSEATKVWFLFGTGADESTGYVNNNYGVFPALYLKPNIKIVSGNGDTEPYVLAV